MKYVLDANVLIEAHRRYYSFDLVPSFWDKLKSLATNGNIITIEKIKDEICRGDSTDDPLSTWFSSEFCDFSMPIDDQEVLESYAEIIQWAQDNEQFNPSAKSEFASVGDSWLIAYAKAKNCTVVTHEQFKPEVKKRILIPNVCKAFNITYIDTFDMLRRLNTKL